MRFFGRIHGTEKDYYIVEATVPDEGEGEANENIEAKGTGVNLYSYFVANDSLSEWEKLPDLAPKDIAASRRIKVLFTGNLERQIYTNPYFFGQEKHYLRAQISRITHSTTLFPKGLYKISEEEDTRKIEPNEPEEGELVLPTTSEMQSMDMWVHACTNILLNCRTAHQDPEEEEGVDPEEKKKQIEAADPYEPLLKPITADQPVNLTDKIKTQAW